MTATIPIPPPTLAPTLAAVDDSLCARSRLDIDDCRNLVAGLKNWSHSASLSCHTSHSSSLSAVGFQWLRFVALPVVSCALSALGRSRCRFASPVAITLGLSDSMKKRLWDNNRARVLPGYDVPALRFD